MTTSKLFSVYIGELKKSIKEYTVLSKNNDHFLEDLKDSKNRLKDVQSLWKHFFDVPVMQEMSNVVDSQVKLYLGDFFYNDLLYISNSPSKKFGWYVYEYGTHLVPLEADENKIQNSKDWMTAVEQNYGNRGVLYSIDFNKQTLKKLKSFDKLSYHILPSDPFPGEKQAI